MTLTIIVGIAFLLVGIVLLFAGLQARKKALAAQKWPTVSGRITSATLEEDSHVDRETHRTSVSYVPTIQYKYQVGESSLVGNRIGFSKTGYDYNTARKKLAQYPLDLPVTVFYNPLAPKESVLNTSTRGSIVLIIVSIIVMAIGIVIPVGSLLAK
jgi:hypothetical protein